MLTFLLKLDLPVLGSLITASATCLSALIGFTAVFFQIGRQGRNAIRANSQNEALKRKVEIYERTLETSRKAQDAILALTGYLRTFAIEVELARDLREQNRKVQAPSARFPDYRRISSEATQSIISVTRMIESWHIIEPKLDIVRDAIGMGLDGLMEVTRRPAELFHVMPVPGFEENWLVPDETVAQQLEDRIARESYQMMRLSGWISDFQIEMQILLLSELFPNRVERREPPDTEQFCIRLDRHREISEKINSSPWGKRRVEMEAEAWQRFAPATTK